MADTVDYKVFNDPIHGLVKLDPLLIKIIDTPQFQRLRNLKQLGATSYVYPGATHTRFEHSIGVAYLAGEFVQALMENQPKLKITPAEKLCVQIAGLCHDLGHGPFSHLYDGKVIPEIERVINAESQNASSWKHETASIDMFNHLVRVNKLEDDIKTAGIKDEEEHDPGKNIKKPKLEPPKDLDKQLNQLNNLDFIRKLINPKYVNKTYQLAEGHTPDRSFLYEIVANKRNEIDVDKWDYFARDCHYLGIRNSFDYRRLILCARVCIVEEEGEKKKEEKRTEICFRDKEVFNLYDMFYTRFCLHKRAYKHKVSTAIGCMITDAFVKAYEHITINGFNLYGAKGDMEAYTKLTDDVFEQILNPRDPDNSEDLKPATELLARIHRRDLYKCVCEFHTKNLEITKEAVRAQLPEEYKQVEHFLVDMIKLDYGMGEKDPIQHVGFYKKNSKQITTKEEQPQNEEIQEPPIKRISLTRKEVSHLLPETFAEKTIRIYYKGTDVEILKSAKEYFEGDDFKTKFNNFLKKPEEAVKRKETQDGPGGTPEASSKSK